MKKGNITSFMEKNYKHFNSAALLDAAIYYKKHISKGGKMLISLAGAMSTAEIGISLSEMINNDKVHIISCTGANLEEDIMNLIAHNSYKRIPDYRNLNAIDEKNLLAQNYNRVTDTCIPEDEAFRLLQDKLEKVWDNAYHNHKKYFPHEYIYMLFENNLLDNCYKIDKNNSWVYTAYKKNIPIICPGWEDSTTGNIFAANVIKSRYNSNIVKNGIDYMVYLADWYIKESKNHDIGFFQIGGGISGDFPICVVPMLHQDLNYKIKCWSYFCQISDSTTSYGSYSGAVPNEKITWGKLDIDTPKFMIESDATICAPLLFNYVLNN